MLEIVKHNCLTKNIFIGWVKNGENFEKRPGVAKEGSFVAAVD